MPLDLLAVKKKAIIILFVEYEILVRSVAQIVQDMYLNQNRPLLVSVFSQKALHEKKWKYCSMQRSSRTESEIGSI